MDFAYPTCHPRNPASRIRQRTGTSAPSSGDVCVPQRQSEAVRHGHDIEEGYEFAPLAVDGKGEVDRRHYAVVPAEHLLHRLEKVRPRSRPGLPGPAPGAAAFLARTAR